ncbi:hypothetical protein LCM23_12780 [Cytobacillus kochii]|uniref:hypothetical protein n=1 Tax=Cytobacillus TaxID=2675230 RepID=UPI001CD61E0E|nr:hypothetical protein [Cytobacillus kochii]MCA1026968.1 hypothetical protein [Cytobacillus kochii]MDM5209457.1 hypothetical protein [Cytobacillus kochii]
MYIGAWLLFGSAIFTSVLASVIVIRILRKEYLPVIQKLEKEDGSTTSEKDDITKEA